MITVRKSKDRGHFDHGWLDTWHTFSFSDYQDPAHMGFRTLRVINEDFVREGGGFGTHGHRDMEIITYVVSGALEHRDSLGNGSVIHAGDVQRMSAGTGVRHSEVNASKIESVHLLQIWILPEKLDLEPGYEQKYFDPDDRRGAFVPLVTREGRDGSLRMNQDAAMYGALLRAGETVTHRLAAGRYGWVQVVGGALTVNGVALGKGDGAAISDERELTIAATQDVDLLFFDLT